MDSKEIGRRLKEAIKASPYSQKEIAEKVGISENGLGNYLKGIREISALLLSEIAQLCNSNLEWIITGKGEKIDSSAASPIHAPLKVTEPEESKNKSLSEYTAKLMADQVNDQPKSRYFQALIAAVQGDKERKSEESKSEINISYEESLVLAKLRLMPEAISLIDTLLSEALNLRTLLANNVIKENEKRGMDQSSDDSNLSKSPSS